MSEFRCSCPPDRHTTYCDRKRAEHVAKDPYEWVAVIGIDPGDKHTGWCVHTKWATYSGEIHHEGGKFGAVITWLENTIHTYRKHGFKVEVVFEEWRLYENQATKQVGSDFKASQLIGGIKTVCGKLGVPVVSQGAGIKKPTRRQLRARGIRYFAAAKMGHARDAETHVWHRVLRRPK